MPRIPGNISPDRLKLLGGLPKNPRLRIRWDDHQGVASLVRGDLHTVITVNPGMRDVRREAADQFVRNFGTLVGPPELPDRIRPLRLRVDRLQFSHLEFQVHHASGIEVYGARVVAHFDAQRRLVQLQSSSPPHLEADVVAKVMAPELRQIAALRFTRLPGFAQLAARRGVDANPDFPLVGKPRLVLYPWQQSLRLSYVSYGFGPQPEHSRSIATRRRKGKAGQSESRVQFGQLFVDAKTGEPYRFAPTRSCVTEVPASGQGVGIAPQGGARPVRPLKVVRVEGSKTYRLRDTTRDRHILVFDAGGDEELWPDDLPRAFADGTLPLSEDTQGDAAWKKFASATGSDATRTASQQPEAEAAFMAGLIADWYQGIDPGRRGWDDDAFTSTSATAAQVPANLPLRIVTHFPDPDTRMTRAPSASFEMGVANNQWFAWIALSDGDPMAKCQSTHDRGFEYVAGSRTIVAHEYQHAITNFAFRDADGNPGLFGSGPMSWHNALHEGIADAMGCLFANDWQIGRDVSRSNLAFRNLAFPRDASAWMNQPLRSDRPACGLGGNNLDHFADAGAFTGDLCHYDRGTIIGHAIYLLAAGGVHARTQRTPAFVPVRGIGNEAAARIVYRAVTEYLGNVGAETGTASVDSQVFLKFAEGCRSAAGDLFGADSREYRTTDLALYAVGLQDSDDDYGADVTCLPAGAEWAGSQPFIALPSAADASPDLVVRNPAPGPASPARVSVRDAAGTEKKYDNQLYCRVRNIGDQNAGPVRVDFSWAPIGSAAWQPVRDQGGAVQSLTIPAAPVGFLGWPDGNTEPPPDTDPGLASLRVKWCIPAPPAGQKITRLRLRVVITASGDVNPFDKEMITEIACIDSAF